LRYYGEVIRQEPCEERIGHTVEHGDAAGARRNATRRPGSFVSWVRRKACPYCRYGRAPFSCPARQSREI